MFDARTDQVDEDGTWDIAVRFLEAQMTRAKSLKHPANRCNEKKCRIRRVEPIAELPTQDLRSDPRPMKGREDCGIAALHALWQDVARLD